MTTARSIVWLFLFGACASSGTYRDAAVAPLDAASDATLADAIRSPTDATSDDTTARDNSIGGDSTRDVRVEDASLATPLGERVDDGIARLAGEWSTWVSGHARSNGNIVAIYRREESTPEGVEGALYIRERTSGPNRSWSSRRIIDDRFVAGIELSTAMDAEGRIHVAYIRGTEWSIAYTREMSPGGEFLPIVEIHARAAYRPTVIALANGNALVSYMRENIDGTADLEIADIETTNGNANVVRRTVVAQDVSSGTAAAQSGGALLVAYNSNDGMLGTRYRAAGASAFSNATGHGSSNMGLGPHIGLDASGRTSIVFFDSRNYDMVWIQQAVSPGTFGARGIIDATGSAGKVSSLAFDAHNLAHIAYCDATNLDLRYATQASQGQAFEIQTLAAEGDVGRSPSVFIDHNNRVHILFVNLTEGSLMHMELP